MNVLITCAGSAAAINVIKSLKFRTDIKKIVGIDANPLAAGLYHSDRAELVPPFKSPSYIPALLNICHAHQVEAIIPIHPEEIEIIAAAKTDINQSRIFTLLPDIETIQLCNDKNKMNEVAAQLDILIPSKIEHSAPVFPLFAKPNHSSGSKGTIKIVDRITFDYYLQQHPNWLYQDFIDGKEYTVDILCNQEHELIVASARTRLMTKDGQSIKGKIEEHPYLIKLCRNICREIKMVGPCNIQFIESAGEIFFIECNPRYASGGLMLTTYGGANIPWLALQLMKGKSLPFIPTRSDIIMLRYWEEIIVDEEDIEE